MCTSGYQELHAASSPDLVRGSGCPLNRVRALFVKLTKHVRIAAGAATNSGGTVTKVVGVGSTLDDDEHVESEIGLYALGVLSEADDSRVLTHLIRCAACCALSDDLGDAAVLVSMLSADDWLTMHSRKTYVL